MYIHFYANLMEASAIFFIVSVLLLALVAAIVVIVLVLCEYCLLLWKQRKRAIKSKDVEEGTVKEPALADVESPTPLSSTSGESSVEAVEAYLKLPELLCTSISEREDVPVCTKRPVPKKSVNDGDAVNNNNNNNDAQDKHCNLLTGIGRVYLDPRSLLETYADFFAHPDDFINIANDDFDDSRRKRFVAVLKYYLNSFYPARKHDFVLKPYNPILGETFRCRWTLPNTKPSSTSKTKGGPFPGSATNQMTFIAEQVSHKPPISTFYVEHPDAGVSCNTHINTRPYLVTSGLAIGFQMAGKATIKIHKHNETYTATFPCVDIHASVTEPWFELVGKVELCCKQTGYRAEIEFMRKPFFRGKAHQIQGHIFHTGQKSALMHLKGEWNGHIYLKRDGASDYHLFTDVRQKPDVRKECIPVMEQKDRESRKLWRHVTTALFHNNIEMASQAKRFIEQRQRDEKAHRDQTGQQWKPRHFVCVGDGSPSDAWRYCEPLEQRTDGP